MQSTDDYKDKGLERNNAEAREEIPKHKCNEDDRQGKNSDFMFQSYRQAQNSTEKLEKSERLNQPVIWERRLFLMRLVRGSNCDLLNFTLGPPRTINYQ